VVDDLVVARESWFFAAADLVSKKQGSMLETFGEARRWSRELGFPRYVFAKVDSEPKPIFVDFESPVYVDILARLIRQALEKNADARVSVVEMHPSLDELWLRDSAGQYYTSELLLVAIESDGR